MPSGRPFCFGRSGWVGAPTEKRKAEVADLVLHPVERNITGNEIHDKPETAANGPGTFTSILALKRGADGFIDKTVEVGRHALIGAFLPDLSQGRAQAFDLFP
jgi:hypothetical protein